LFILKQLAFEVSVIHFVDQVKTRMTEEAVEKSEKSADDEAKSLANMRLAYQDLSIQKKTQVCFRKHLTLKCFSTIKL
jgi:hypothetical protein